MNRLLNHRVLVGLVLVISITPSLLVASDSKMKKTTIAYREVDGHKILADVYRPQGDAVCPVVVWIHGGALILGHREGVNSQVRSLVEEQGCALVSIDYRLAPETKLPGLISDIEAAFDWLANDGAIQFHLDPTRIVVIGGSAGGYLTLITGYRVRPQPAALVAFYGYGDLTGDWYSTPSPHARHNGQKITREEATRQTDGAVISDARKRKGDGLKIYLHYRQNGVWPEEVSGFDRAAIAEKIAPFEPVQNVTADFPPTLLIHGTDDTDVPFEQSILMVRQFEQHAVPFILKAIDNAEHGLGGGEPRQVENAWKTMRTFVVKHLTSSE